MQNSISSSDKKLILDQIKFGNFLGLKSAIIQARKKNKNPLADSFEYLKEAIIRGNFEFVQYLLYSGAKTEDENSNALHVAAYFSRPQIMRHLIINGHDDYFKMALFATDAISENDKQNLVYQTQRFFQSGINAVQIKAARQELMEEIKLFLMLPSNPTPEQLKKNNEITEIALEAFDKFHESAFMINPNAKNSAGQTALQIAATSTNKESKKYMTKILTLAQDAVSDPNISPQILNQLAAMNVPKAAAPLTYSDSEEEYSGKQRSNSEIHNFIRDKYIKEEEERAKQREKKSKAIDNFLEAARNGQINDEYIAQIFSKEKISININSGYENGQNTPLHEAVAGGHLEAVKSLIKNGASVKIANSQGLTAADLAINLAKKPDPKNAQHKEIAEFLINHLRLPSSRSSAVPVPDVSNGKASELQNISKSKQK